MAGRSFGVSPDRNARFDVTRLEPMLADLHDRLEVRETFACFTLEEVETTYHVAGGNPAKRVRELIISN